MFGLRAWAGTTTPDGEEGNATDGEGRDTGGSKREERDAGQDGDEAHQADAGVGNDLLAPGALEQRRRALDVVRNADAFDDQDG